MSTITTPDGTQIDDKGWWCKRGERWPSRLAAHSHKSRHLHGCNTTSYRIRYFFNMRYRVATPICKRRAVASRAVERLENRFAFDLRQGGLGGQHKGVVGMARGYHLKNPWLKAHL